MDNIKIAKTQHNIHELFKNRWSALSYSDQPLRDEDIMTLIEAASWSFSSNNIQPWRFIYALKGSETFQKILDTLMPGNITWAKNTAAFVVGIAKTNLDKEGNPPNGAAEMDLGSAYMLLILQAMTMKIYAHPMGGFDKIKLSTIFELDQYLKPMVVIALGYLDAAEKLNEPYLTRELSPRVRKPLSEIILKK